VKKVNSGHKVGSDNGSKRSDNFNSTDFDSSDSELDNISEDEQEMAIEKMLQEQIT